MNLLIFPIERQNFYIIMLITVVGSMLGLSSLLGGKNHRDRDTGKEVERREGGKRKGEKEETILTFLWGIRVKGHEELLVSCA